MQRIGSILLLSLFVSCYCHSLNEDSDSITRQRFNHQSSFNSQHKVELQNWCEKNCKECYCVTDDYWNQYCYKCKQHCNEYKFKCNDDDDQWYPDYPDYPNDDDHWYDDDDDHYEDKFESVLEFLKQEDRLVENEHHLIQKEEKVVEKDISNLQSYDYDDDWYDDDDDHSYDDDDDRGINIKLTIGDFNLNQNVDSQHSSGAAVSTAAPSLGAALSNDFCTCSNSDILSASTNFNLAFKTKTTYQLCSRLKNLFYLIINDQKYSAKYSDPTKTALISADDNYNIKYMNLDLTNVGSASSLDGFMADQSTSNCVVASY